MTEETLISVPEVVDPESLEALQRLVLTRPISSRSETGDSEEIHFSHESFHEWWSGMRVWASSLLHEFIDELCNPTSFNDDEF